MAYSKPAELWGRGDGVLATQTALMAHMRQLWGGRGGGGVAVWGFELGGGEANVDEIGRGEIFRS